MNKEDYCLNDNGEICSKLSLFLIKVHGYRRGDIVHASVIEFGDPNFEDWKKEYKFIPVPTDMWDAIIRELNTI